MAAPGGGLATDTNVTATVTSGEVRALRMWGMQQSCLVENDWVSDPFSPASSLGVRWSARTMGMPIATWTATGEASAGRVRGTRHVPCRCGPSLSGSASAHAEESSGALTPQPARSAYWLGIFRSASGAGRANRCAPPHVRDVWRGAPGAPRLRGRATRLREISRPVR